MAIEFNKPGQQNAPPATQQSPGTDMVVKDYDITADREQMTQALAKSPEVDALLNSIEVDNPDTIVTFGAEAAEEISKASDIVLNSVSMSQLDDSSEMLNTLTKVMAKFDIEEIKEKPGLFGNLFGNLRKQLDKILAKYNTMGGEIDKIYVQLKQYESEIKQANRRLDQMFEANVGYYHSSRKVHSGGRLGCQQIRDYIQQRENDMAALLVIIPFSLS